MIKIPLSILLMAILGWLLPTLGPWYLIALAGFGGGLLLSRSWLALLIGFVVGATLWYVQIILLQNASPSDLPERMAELMQLGGKQNLMLLTAALGGLVMGLGAAAGASILGLKK
jgi:hypothetical protein